mgnify:CR=1 FL=1
MIKFTLTNEILKYITEIDKNSVVDEGGAMLPAKVKFLL